MFTSMCARYRALLAHGPSSHARTLTGCTVALLALAACAFAATPPIARAGRYHVYSCRTPSDQTAPADGWTPSTSPASATLIAADTCAGGGALVAGLADGVEHEVNTAATWRFATLSSDTLVGATLWRAGDADGGSVANAYYEFWMAGPEDIDRPPYVFDECVASFSCPVGGIGDYQEVRSTKNLVTVPNENLGAHLYITASCSGEAGFRCPEGKKDANGYAAVVYLYAADLVLEQTSQPSVVPGSVGGELASASTLSGTVSLTFEASDSGSGVYQAVVEVDGKAIGSTVLDGNGGRCANVGQTSDGLPAFLYLKPCASTVSADVPLDTTSLSNGLHHVVVSVTNAAGNRAVVIDRKVEVSNGSSTTANGSTSTSGSTTFGTTLGATPSSSGAPAPAGAPNGSPATTQAVLALHWRSRSGTTLTSRWGRSQTIVGRLMTTGGAPISGALLEVGAVASSQGAHASAIAAVRTSADGRFAVRLSPHSTSEQIVVAYRAHLGDALPAASGTLALRVPASLTLRVAPRISHVHGTIRFSGALRGGHIPAGGKQIVLQARAPGSAWRTFEALSTDRRGRYRASYRFRLAGPVTYRFRAVCRQEADFPFAAGISNVVSVKER